MSISKKLMTTGAAGDTYVEDVFSTYVYEGDGVPRGIVNGIDLDGKGGLVWTKIRTSSGSNQLTDTESGFRLVSDDPNSKEANQGNVLFNSDGYTVNGSSFFNGGDSDYVSWTWRKEPSFFDMVTYTGDGSFARSIPHNLGSVPGVMILKALDTVTSYAYQNNWEVYHKDLGNRSTYAISNGLFLNETDSKSTGAFNRVETQTDTNFVMCGDAEARGNVSGIRYVVYLFAHDNSDEGMIQCGSYTGTGDSNGPTIDLGWAPQWLLIKNASNTGPWTMIDTMRGDAYLLADASDKEEGTDFVDMNATGFKPIRSSTYTNGSGQGYIYMAIRRPNKPAEEFDREDLYEWGSWAFNAAGSPPLIQPAGGTDDKDVLMMRKVNGSVYQAPILFRNARPKYLETHSADGEKEDSQVYWGYDGFSADIGNAGTNNYFLFKRAPGFLDVTTYSNSGSTANNLYVPHQLGVKPSMIWVKKRNGGQNWYVWTDHAVTNYSTGDNPPYFTLQSINSIRYDEPGIWGDGDGLDFTDTGFTVGKTAAQGSGSDYVAYVFGDTPGVSASGSYTGNGLDLGEQFVDVGFPARVVMIRRHDNAGGWIMHYDLTASASRYTYLGTLDGEFGSPFIKQTPNGFKVGPDGGQENEMNGDYFYYAIA